MAAGGRRALGDRHLHPRVPDQRQGPRPCRGPRRRDAGRAEVPVPRGAADPRPARRPRGGQGGRRARQAREPRRAVNADLVRLALARWNATPDVTEQAFSEFAAPDMVLDLSANVLNPATYEGFEGFRRFVEQVGEAWAEFRMEPEEVFEEGN